MMNTSPTVLLIDGNEDSRELYGFVLRHYGFRVLREHEGGDAHAPDLVIIADEDEQGREGSERALEWTHRASAGAPPVLLLTSYAQGPRWDRIRASNGALVLVMPVLPTTLVVYVRKLLGERDGFGALDADTRRSRCCVPGAIVLCGHDDRHQTIVERA